MIGSHQTTKSTQDTKFLPHHLKKNSELGSWWLKQYVRFISECSFCVRISMRKSIFAAALLLALSASVPAMFMNMSVQVPVDRVTKNVEAWIKEKPADAQGYYVLGRIHAMAYAYGPELSLWGSQPAGGRRGGRAGAGAPPAGGENADPFNGQLPGFAPYDSIQVQRRDGAKGLTADDAKHLEASIANYSKAIELDPKSALYELGLGWILQETSKHSARLPEKFSAEVNVTDAEKAGYDALIKKLGDADARAREDASKALVLAMPKPYAQVKAVKSADPEVAARAAALVKAHFSVQALEHYRKAYQMNVEKDLAGRAGIAADSQIAAEAGEHIVEILKELPEVAKENEAKEVAANVQKIRSKMGPITPVIFAMPGEARPEEGLGGLIDSARRVKFDLAADGSGREWPWLKPETALLVWDPAGTGKITDGRQLFGSRTWFVWFRDGYEALSTLDDNRDGKLTSAELQGIGVWQDKNTNGISDPGEVLTTQQAGIAAISTRAASGADGVLTSSGGIRFTDGRSVPSFDWVTSPAAEESVAGH